MSTKNHDEEFAAIQAEIRRQVEAHMQKMEQEHQQAAIKTMCAKLDLNEEEFNVYVADMDAIRKRIYTFVGTGQGIGEYMIIENDTPKFNELLFDSDVAKLRKLSKVLIELENEREKDIKENPIPADLLEEDDYVDPLLN